MLAASFFMRKFFLTLACLSLFLPLSCLRRSSTDMILEQLDEALKMQATYDSYFQKRVVVLNQLKAGRTEPDQIYGINKKLAEEYASYSLDSTVAYLNENIRLAETMKDPYKKAESELTLAQEYIMAGYHIEASDILYKYNGDGLEPYLKMLFFDACHTFSGELLAYYQNKSTYQERYRRRETFRDSLLKYVEPSCFLYYKLKREEAENKGDKDLEKAYLDSMLLISPENSHNYAKACFHYSYNFDSDDDKIKWLAKSAIADVMCSTKDYASLHELAKLLFARGDINRAFRYAADHCLPDALAFNGKLRPWLIVHFFPELEKAYVQKSGKQKRIMIALVFVTSAMLVLLVLVTVVLFLRHRILLGTRKKLEESYLEIEKRNTDLEFINLRLKELNESLKETDKVKQEYIALFLGILSENINETRRYKSHVLKYIRRGHEKYLADEIEALPSKDEDIQQFYKMFDETFTNLYPDFVEKFNSLLSEGESIYPKGNDILSPELRIFALIKLGITDSSKIASLLHYSSNTIYNYRAKTKNKAKGDRDGFEEAVKALV